MRGMEPFATMLSEWVARNRLDQTEAGVRIGVSDATVSRWTSGARSPSFADAIRVAKVLGVSLDTLAGMKGATPDRDYLEELIIRYGPREIIRRVLSSDAGADCAGPSSPHAPPVPPKALTPQPLPMPPELGGPKPSPVGAQRKKKRSELKGGPSGGRGKR